MNAFSKYSQDSKLIKVFLGLSASVMISCGQSNDSEIFKAIKRKPTATEIQNTIAKSPTVFRVNLTTNRMSYYVDGRLADQWNVATADVTGKSHQGEIQVTPEGIFSPDSIVHCPVWNPSFPIDPLTGKKVTDPALRLAQFKLYPETYGACGPSNPLGRYVIWFDGAYGIHGNSNESVLKNPDPESRRVSGGCIRNPNAKIKKVFHDVFLKFPVLKSFAEKVTAAENLPSEAPRTMIKEWIDFGARIIVLRSATDPVLPSLANK